MFFRECVLGTNVLFFLGLRPGHFLERVLFALRALFFLGLRPGLFFPPGILPPAGNFLLAQKVPQKRLPPVALRGLWPHLQPSWGFPHLRPSARVAGPRAKLGGCQQCRLKPPRNIRLTRNPLGAFLLCFHQRGSQDAVHNLEPVSTALCIQPRVFDTRLSNTRMSTFHYFVSIRWLT